MCGIAGLMTRDGRPPDAAVLDKLLAALSHRGPDGDGRYVSGGVAMVQTRLAIIDLETGDQPLYEPGGAALVANGEIYNYVELRAELEGAVDLRTRSDCEPPLHLYRRDGLAFAERLRGMYAIAIHDPAEGGRLVLSRDPFGIKPLYYVQTDDCFAFASEPQALIKAGLLGEPASVDADARRSQLQLQFGCGEATPIRGVQRVAPGETLVVQRGRIVERRRRCALPAGGPEEIGEEAAIARLDAALRDSVEVHQRSDVPYGLFLSGGVDSSAILSMMAELNERPVIAFTAGFQGGQVHDERDHACRLAERLGAEHHEIDFAEADFWETLPRIAAAMDDPAADYAILPTWKLAERAAQDLKVVLCGEGGDELFAGYGRYRALKRPWWLGGRGIRNRGVFDGLGVLRDAARGWRDPIAGKEAMHREMGRNRLQIAQAIDCEDWLSNDLLTKLDRCLMAHGLEGRTPFLDPAVADAAFRLPDGLKIRGKRGKWLLRRWLDRRLPEAQAFTAKRGFTVPVGAWIAGRAERLGPLVATHPAVEEIAEPAAVRDLFAKADRKRAGFAAWGLLFYALWKSAVIDGREPGGRDVFAMLEESR
ncbi:MAG: asparagine synthase (glutamine-hydrolyzing) [Marivibrio sp.]|uniref:asparagine synthase (glutamine-hydrolyzing) n=1 Tax=Marivibrio sp. TaxID=2039719 RepID=UPI0032EC3E0F